MPQAELKRLSTLVENYLSDCLSRLPGYASMPPGLVEAMNYSLLGGGKRLRPVLLLSSAGLFGLDRASALPFAAALEFIHSYSLIHDDLPAMDDDDMRRGRPSSHKRFGEATAILAGDALLTEAFSLMASGCTSGEITPERGMAALAEVARAAGSGGMVGGQFLDMLYTGADARVNAEDLSRMQAMKTGALIRASCLAGARLAGANEKEAADLAAYGEAFGAAFQITDDILDETGDPALLGKPVGSDAKSGKTTYPALFGLEESRRMANLAAERAASVLASYCVGSYNHREAQFLQKLALFTRERVY